MSERSEQAGGDVTTEVADPSLGYMLGRLEIVERRVRSMVRDRRAHDPDPDDPFRGLYLSRDHVESVLSTSPAVRVAASDPDEEGVLAEIEAAADDAESEGADIRLRRLARAFGLSQLDVDLLLVAMAPDLDSRFERLYGYLNDDVSRRRATVGLALGLGAVPAVLAAARARLLEPAPLIDGGLVLVEDVDAPFLGRSLRVPDRVTSHLMGDDTPAPEILEMLVAPPPPFGESEPVARAIASGALVYLRDHPGAPSRALAVGALTLLGAGSLVLDLRRLPVGQPIDETARLLSREALLLDAGLVIGPVEEALALGPGTLRPLTELPAPTVLIGRTSWDPHWSRAVPAVLDVARPTTGELGTLWDAEVDGDGDTSVDSLSLAQFRLAPEDIVRSVTSARLHAVVDDENVDAAHLLAGARMQNAAGLERLARRIEPAVGWDDLVLPKQVLAQLQELSARARNRVQVLEEWALRSGGGRGTGVTALFAGEPGTGKTMAAEVLAHELGLDLYAVNLAAVVDKYVGETEKNLERIFAEADGVNGVILFDEADALFGKRSEVSDAHDRHANIEVAYLLQRMETFDGLAVLATNLRANLDEAFARRFDGIIDFPMPDEEQRLVLWQHHLRAPVPLADDVDLGFCARAFELSGGNIRSITLTAAYLAAERVGPVSMLDVVRATEREYRKLGRLVHEAEFGPYYQALDGISG